MSLRVAITRALPDAERTAARVRERGGDAVLAPLLIIIPCAYNTNVEDAQALIFTSANGVRAFPDARRHAHTRVLTVGDATAEAAREAGFVDVTSADGDVDALAVVAKRLDPPRGKLVHIGGEHVAGDLSGALAAAGFSVERRVAYAARPACALPEALNAPIDVVLFHSARAAEAYRALGAPSAGMRTAACLSPAVVEAAGLGWARTIVAARPREDALLDAVFGPLASPAGASA